MVWKQNQQYKTARTEENLGLERYPGKGESVGYGLVDGSPLGFAIDERLDLTGAGSRKWEDPEPTNLPVTVEFMPIDNPTQLVDAFKKSGEFDRLRRELLSQFQQGDGITAFKSWAEKVAQQRLESDQKLQLLSQEAIYKELMQEMDRFTTVERAAGDVQMLSDQAFASSIRKSVQDILLESKRQITRPPKDIQRDAIRGLPVKPPAIQPSKLQPPKPRILEPPVSPSPALQSPSATLPTPPPVVTFEQSQPTLTRILETEKPAILAIAPEGVLPEPPALTTAGAVSTDEVKPADGSQVDDNAMTS